MSLAIQREPEAADGFGRRGTFRLFECRFTPDSGIHMWFREPSPIALVKQSAEHVVAARLDQLFQGRHIRVVIAPGDDFVRLRHARSASRLRETGVPQCFCERVVHEWIVVRASTGVNAGTFGYPACPECAHSVR